MAERLIIEETSIYEIDEECFRQRMEQPRRSDAKKEEPVRGEKGKFGCRKTLQSQENQVK